MLHQGPPRELEGHDILHGGREIGGHEALYVWSAPDVVTIALERPAGASKAVRGGSSIRLNPVGAGSAGRRPLRIYFGALTGLSSGAPREFLTPTPRDLC